MLLSPCDHPLPDINECSLGSNRCDTNAICADTPGSYTCSCNQGYSGDGYTCREINECSGGSHNCDINATCTNTQGSYTCSCNEGYAGDGFNCTDINECSSGFHRCHINATCTNTPGSYFCTCKEGYPGDGFICGPIGMMFVSDELLGKIFMAVLYNGGLESLSFSPFALNSVLLPRAVAYDPRTRTLFWTEASGSIRRENINGTDEQVIADAGVEDPTGIALDTIRRKVFWADDGLNQIVSANFDGTSKKILVNTDINGPRSIIIHEEESLMFWTDSNQPDSSRIERAGLDGGERYIIVNSRINVPTGLAFSDNGRRVYWCDSSLDIIESVDLWGNHRMNHVTAEYISPLGLAVFNDRIVWTDWVRDALGVSVIGSSSYSYHHDRIFRYPYGIRVHIDINECGLGSNGCDRNAICSDTPVFYTCTCNRGYDGDGYTCIDINECSGGSHNCDINATCTNTQGSYTCSCNDGYAGDGLNCVDINECSIGSDRCHINATCTNTPGSYTCTCKEDYPGDGFTCGPIGIMFVGDGLIGSIFTAVLYRGGLESLTFSPLSLNSVLLPRSVAFDPRTRTLFWTETSGSIRRENINGTDELVIADVDVEDPTGIALDTIRRKVFWTDDGLNQIVSANFDGSSRKILVNRDINRPLSIIIHEEEGIMFWTDGNYPDSARIERAGIDGSERHVIVNSRITLPTGLAFSDNGRRIYWCDSSLDIIESVDLWGNHRTNHVTAEYISPLGLAVFDDRIVWTDWVRDALGVSLIGSCSYSYHHDRVFRYPYGIHVHTDSMEELEEIIGSLK